MPLEENQGNRRTSSSQLFARSDAAEGLQLQPVVGAHGRAATSSAGKMALAQRDEVPRRSRMWGNSGQVKKTPASVPKRRTPSEMPLSPLSSEIDHAYESGGGTAVGKVDRAPNPKSTFGVHRSHMVLFLIQLFVIVVLSVCLAVYGGKASVHCNITLDSHCPIPECGNDFFLAKPLSCLTYFLYLL